MPPLSKLFLLISVILFAIASLEPLTNGRLGNFTLVPVGLFFFALSTLVA